MGRQYKEQTKKVVIFDTACISQSGRTVQLPWFYSVGPRTEVLSQNPALTRKLLEVKTKNNIRGNNVREGLE